MIIIGAVYRLSNSGMLDLEIRVPGYVFFLFYQLLFEGFFSRNLAFIILLHKVQKHFG